MSKRHHAVITGTGRAGTTFLVELLTHLGLDTGYRTEQLVSKKDQLSRAGLEHDIRRPGVPYLIKSPHFSNYANDVLARQDIVIDHVFIPIRNLAAAAESRRRVSKANQKTVAQKIKRLLRPREYSGGLWQTTSLKKGEQEHALLMSLYSLVLELSNEHVPVTFIQFPRLAHESDYLYQKLRPILRGIDFSEFDAVYQQVADPGLINRFGDNE
jgi:hypothetical protein